MKFIKNLSNFFVVTAVVAGTSLAMDHQYEFPGFRSEVSGPTQRSYGQPQVVDFASLVSQNVAPHLARFTQRIGHLEM